MPIRNYLIDMDGVLVRGAIVIPGAELFIQRLIACNCKYLILTNNPLYTPGDLSHRLHALGLEIPETHIFTAAQATAHFLSRQRPNGKAFVIGESGLTAAIHSAGYIITDIEPDYVVLGSTAYNLELVTKAIRLITAGAKFIATNPDGTASESGWCLPAELWQRWSKASGVAPFFMGKPNPLMMRTALRYLDEHSENTTIIGDRMDTDIVAGIESGMETILVLTGVTKRKEIHRFPYQPTYIYDFSDGH